MKCSDFRSVKLNLWRINLSHACKINWWVQVNFGLSEVQSLVSANCWAIAEWSPRPNFRLSDRWEMTSVFGCSSVAVQIYDSVIDSAKDSKDWVKQWNDATYSNTAHHTHSVSTAVKPDKTQTQLLVQSLITNTPLSMKRGQCAK